MNYQPWKEAASLILVARSMLTSRVGQDLIRNHISATIKADPQGTTALPVSPSEQEQKSLQRLAKRSDLQDSMREQARQEQLARSLESIDYRIMMVKRSALSSFMASAFVFPGGQVEVADFSPRWIELFDRLQIDSKRLDELNNRVKGPRPPMMTNEQSVTLGDAKNEYGVDKTILHPNIALRIAAIRETFEETGVLLTTDNRSNHMSETADESLEANAQLMVQLSEWREKVRHDANTFVDMCFELQQCPDLWSLYEWWDWLTPISVGHKRFDTMFFVCCVDRTPRVVLDNREVTTLKWVTPIEMLEEHTQERVFLAPPQVYELSRLFHQRSYEQLLRYLPERERHGVERWLPVIGTYSNGSISVLPGDDLYPTNPDFVGKKPVPDFPQRLEEMRASACHLNRIELTRSICLAVNNQSRPACGHRAPIAYVKGCEPFALDSKL